MIRRPRPTHQSVANLRGEIDFRAKLSKQHVTGEVLLPDYYKKGHHDKILLERVEATSKKLMELSTLGVGFSPFLELGAERGQRSLVLTNDFGATGVAVDISYHQLRTMEHFAERFDRPRLPVRICCDANNLPFKSNSFPFIFCYQFLHHFPRLAPIMTEVRRVLSGGHFFFDEEPFKRVLKLKLYRQKHKLYSERALTKHRYVRLVESFISEAPSDEVEHGLIENHDISVEEWMSALSLFDERQAELVSIYNVSSRLGSRLRLRNIPNVLLGGTIAGLCRKERRSAVEPEAAIEDLLVCPDCRTAAADGTVDRPSLTKISGGLECTQCCCTFPRRDGVIFLLPKAELEELYPWV